MAKRTSSEPEKVGPGNPPRSTRFRKGQSGNPGGRPKIERDLAKLVDKELDELVFGTDGNGQRIKLTKREYIAKKLVNEAASGNLKAIDRVFDLVSKCGADVNKMVGIDPAVLASFLTRYGGAGESGLGGTSGASGAAA